LARARALTAALAILAPLPGAVAHAQSVVTSPAPDHVEVTVYRAPGRPPGQVLDLEWLNGFALISETRRIDIPAGDSEIRFEGVAGGIQPQSAIVAGFPGPIAERNRDAYLLSAGSLVDRSLGRRVHLRRTSAQTGAVTEQDAVIRSGADGAVVLQTAEGFEALRCTGQNETLRFDEVPQGLSARPTLSVRTHSAQPTSATITLSYLATGFDWRANYVANLSADGSHISLFAWVTLASSDETSFRDADAQAVAGRVNRERVEREDVEVQPLQLRCWPGGRTSDVSSGDLVNELPQAMARNAVGADEAGESIVVTGSRIAAPEALGDLKLYRIPEPVTVAAHSQKQVSFLDQPRVQVRTVYRQRLSAEVEGDIGSPTRFLITRNRRAEGLGMPLPAGGVQLFAQGAGRPILLGEGSLADRAVGEDVEISLGDAEGIFGRIEAPADGDKSEQYRLTVTNDHAAPIAYEAEIEVDEEEEALVARGHIERRNGRPLWRVTIPANGSATLRYRVVERHG
jgi:hypothetical protein